MSANPEFRGPKVVNKCNVYCKIENNNLRSIAHAPNFSGAHNYMEILERQKIKELLKNQEVGLKRLGIDGSKYLEQEQGWVFLYKNYAIFLSVAVKKWQAIKNLQNVLDSYVTRFRETSLSWKNIPALSGIDLELFQLRQQKAAAEKTQILLQKQLEAQKRVAEQHARSLNATQHALVVSSRTKDEEQRTYWGQIVSLVRQEAEEVKQRFAEVSGVLEHIKNAIPPEILEALLRHDQQAPVLQGVSIPEYLYQTLAPLTALVKGVRGIGAHLWPLVVQRDVSIEDNPQELLQILPPPPKDELIPKKEGKKDGDSPTAVKGGPAGDPLSPKALELHQRRTSTMGTSHSSPSFKALESRPDSVPQTPDRKFVPNSACNTPSVRTIGSSAIDSFFKKDWDHLEEGSQRSVWEINEGSEDTRSRASSHRSAAFFEVPKSSHTAGSVAVSSISNTPLSKEGHSTTDLNLVREKLDEIRQKARSSSNLSDDGWEKISTSG